uniref:Uncharacterized protein n=1 Tax=Nelumbo nucifera TaxID=4432 RepID=A0A822ZPL8_NELNU|nr:TPA_asm: hypothetical protein HUJ06_016774 [Nelumbo nucifera]
MGRSSFYSALKLLFLLVQMQMRRHKQPALDHPLLKNHKTQRAPLEMPRMRMNKEGEGMRNKISGLASTIRTPRPSHGPPPIHPYQGLSVHSQRTPDGRTGLCRNGTAEDCSLGMSFVMLAIPEPKMLTELHTIVGLSWFTFDFCSTLTAPEKPSLDLYRRKLSLSLAGYR